MPLAHALPLVERRRPPENVVPFKLPPEAVGEDVMGWAMAQIAEAERRVAALQERVSFLESLSVTDELTGLLNRRGFEWDLRRTLATARRGGQPGVLMVCDLDGFKAVNDRLGHAAGDQVLRRTAAVLRGQTRSTDLVARNGGDEFAVILVGASLLSARRKGQALTTHIPAAAAEAVAGERIEIGVSFGYAAFSGDESEDDLLAAADLAMYEEKRRKGAGR